MRASTGSRVRWVVGILVILAGLAAGGLAAVSQTAACRDWLRRQVLARLNAHMAGQVVVGSLDGNLFDSSVMRGSPLTFPLNQVIKGWTEGVQLMVEGDKVRLWIPPDLAYGDKPTRPGAPAGMLVFDVELLQIQ